MLATTHTWILGKRNRAHIATQDVSVTTAELLQQPVRYVSHLQPLNFSNSGGSWLGVGRRVQSFLVAPYTIEFLITTGRGGHTSYFAAIYEVNWFVRCSANGPASARTVPEVGSVLRSKPSQHAMTDRLALASVLIADSSIRALHGNPYPVSVLRAHIKQWQATRPSESVSTEHLGENRCLVHSVSDHRECDDSHCRPEQG